MKRFEDEWRQLTAAARQAPTAAPVAAPYGFATRVAARAMSGEPPPAMTLFGRFSVRALYLACLLTLAGLAANYLAFKGTEDDEQGLIDPVSEVFSNAS
jgi:hypothetical protein